MRAEKVIVFCYSDIGVYFFKNKQEYGLFPDSYFGVLIRNDFGSCTYRRNQNPTLQDHANLNAKTLERVQSVNNEINFFDTSEAY